MGIFIDLSGQIFGDLIVIKRVAKSGRTNAYWECQCSCGSNIVASGNKLREGQLSCIKCRKPSNLRHEMAYSSEYNIWSNMKARCLNEKLAVFKNYGGRGISFLRKMAVI